MSSLISKKTSIDSVSIKYLLRDIFSEYKKVFGNIYDKLMDEEWSEITRIFMDQRTLLLPINDYQGDNMFGLVLDFEKLNMLFDKFFDSSSSTSYKMNKILFRYNGDKINSIFITPLDRKVGIENYIFEKEGRNLNDNTIKKLTLSSKFTHLKNIIIDPLSFERGEWDFNDGLIPMWSSSNNNNFRIRSINPGKYNNFYNNILGGINNNHIKFDHFYLREGNGNLKKYFEGCLEDMNFREEEFDIFIMDGISYTFNFDKQNINFIINPPDFMVDYINDINKIVPGFYQYKNGIYYRNK